MLKYILFSLLFTLISCVGTVQDAKVKLNSLFDEDKTTLVFGGLEEARAISHNKVEIEFTPSGEVSPNLKYLLYVNNSLSPIEINPDSLDKAANGRVRYLVDNLNINAKYKFKLTLKNNLTQATSKNERELTVTTFDNKTADFKGITSLTKVNGQSDTSVRVDWVSAIMEGSTSTGPWDPLYYEITIIGEGGLSNINNASYTGTDRRKIRVPPSPLSLSPFNYTEWTNLVVGSLTPSTQYYVQVRAVNRLYDEFLNDLSVTNIPVSKEVNTKFLSIKTDPATGVFDFNVESFKVQPGNGAQAKTRIISTWLPASGSYIGYRLFYIKCTGAQCGSQAEVLGTDLLTDETMDAIIAGTAPNGGYVGTNILSSPATSHALTGLDPYKWYQLKLVACRTATCSKTAGDGIASSLRAIRTAPILAPFSGLTAIQHPDSALSLNQISLQFDVPDFATGYADRMEFFCIDPDSVTKEQTSIDYVKMNPGTAMTGSSIPRCNGLIVCGPNSTDCDTNSFNYTLASGTSVRVKGVKTDGTRYCFAASPAIRDEVEQIPVTPVPKDWIIRCASPEVKTPTIAQFSGINSSCGVINNTIAVSWNKPIAGIYSAYRVIWRKINGNEAFSFSAGALDVKNNVSNTNASPYFSSAPLTPDTLNYTLNDLRPGTRYKVGVLTQATDGTDIKWSEFNTNVKDCVTAMPKYKFLEWTRIFAIGPKTDGRVPFKRDYIGTTSVRSIRSEAYIHEALNNDGIPYEVSKDLNGDADLDGTYFKPPGHYAGSYSPSGFGDDFDGAPGAFGDATGTVIAASNAGIVSLAWKDVTLDFLGNEFKDCQLNNGETPINTYCYNNNGSYSLPAQKNKRKYGYKVYRSADNRLSWQDITKAANDADSATGTSLIYGRDYSYYKRADQTPTVERMAFFTDYSVQAIKADPTARSRARIYWYRIVPYFDNRQLGLDGSQSGLTSAPNEIKVILPPDNMALMHRWMSNRQACNELDRGAMMDKEGNYTCPFNGFGGKAKGFPWNPTNTVIDLGGHMLIDRFELGCNITRGDVDGVPVDTGNSFYKRVGVFTGFKSWLPLFKGVATDEDGADVASKRFAGCTTRDTSNFFQNLAGTAYGGLLTTKSNYRRFIKGDCVSFGETDVSENDCSANIDKAIYMNYSFPGAFEKYNILSADGTTRLDCATTTTNEPTLVSDLMNSSFRKNLVIQSEYAAVLHHASRGGGRQFNPDGPTGPIMNWNSNDSYYGKPQSCYINLASIGTDDNWTARWIPAGDLELVKGSANFIHSTMGQAKANGSLFNATNFKAPTAAMMNDGRFTDDTKVGRVLSSNAAKLPPITNLTVGAAQKLCSTYEVEVGFSNNGSNFLSLVLPKQKRLMGRSELVSASAWPDASDNGYVGNFNYSEKPGSARIASLEGDAAKPGYCVSSGKSNGQVFTAYDHNSKMLPQMVRAAAPSMISYANGASMLYGGSSTNDGPINSELCVSKYGIQDIIGNGAEMTSDRLFCDYGADKLYFGRFESGQGYELESALMPNYDGGDNDIIWLGAKVIRETGTGDVEVINGVGSQGRMWADISPNSGYCSIVDDVDPGAGYAGLISRFRDTNDNFNNVFNPDGSLNTNMVKRANGIVQASIDNLRNGDGYFLNFGTNAPGPYLQRKNSWALSKVGYVHENGMALGPYFNPITGIPTRCPGSTCSQSEDNMIASLTYFMDDVDAPKPTVEPSIARFPIGNSQIFNQGISETSYSRGAVQFPIDFTVPENRQGAAQVVYEIRIKLNGSVVLSRKPLVDWAIYQFGSPSGPGTQNFSKISFDVPRGSSLQMVHGGEAQSTMTGRYTLNTVVAEEYYTKRSGIYTAPRCGVLIED